MDEDIIQFIRVLVGDTTEPYTFSDEEIEAVYKGAKDNSYIAAAILLETAAAQFAIRYVALTTDDLRVDASSAAKILLERAKRLRDQAADDDAADTWGAFETVFPFDHGTLWEYEERRRPGAWPWAY